MKVRDYFEVINGLSKKYGERGSCFLWESKSSLKEKLGENIFEIIYSVVNEYLLYQNRNANSRLLGEFFKKDIFCLSRKCKRLERLISFPSSKDQS